jgi:DNA-binding LytR/AlgR family response regulator
VKGETPLLDSVPGRLGRDVLCLQMEDHYVRVHTALGDVMLHGRMADFEAELVGRIDGLKVHRSWWVARKAVASWSREDKTLTLTLSNGLAVPVARDRQADVKAAGWLV